MTLFGQTLDGQQLFGLISLLTLLAFWVLVLGRERDYARWFRSWEAERRARREAEKAREDATGQAHDPDRPGSGPWG